ncbi:MAG TPA: ABC transporter permease, partial [Blastocatellia bacterium]|nr:ABC transporter permease [Blastocatellia bacterium]
MSKLSKKRGDLVKPHLWLIRLIGVIVPRRLRIDWRQEWEAELHHRELLLADWDRLNWRNKFDLLWRSTSAFWDALWLQHHRLEDEMFQDLRFGSRMLFKHKGFTLVAVLSLALGIGANTALFSVVDAVLLKTLAVKEPEQLVLFEWRAGLTFRVNGMSGTSSVPVPPGTKGLSLFRYDVFEKLCQARAAALQDSPLSDFFAFAPLRELTAVIDQQAEIINGQAVSGGYFAGLSVHPTLGRAVTDEDDKPGAPPVVVLSHEFWQEHFGGNPNAIGQPLKLNKVSFTIIGVTPPAFTGTQQVDYHPVVTVPIACERLLSGERSRLGTPKAPGLWWLNLMGRLKPDATFELANESLNGAFQASALEVMPPPRKANEPAQLEPEDYPRLIAESGSRGMLDKRRRYSPII